MPESSPAPKIEIVDDRQNPVSESDPPSNFVEAPNAKKGEKSDVKEEGKNEDVEEKDDKSSKEKKSLIKKLLGCFSCVRPQQKKKEMVT